MHACMLVMLRVLCTAVGLDRSSCRGVDAPGLLKRLRVNKLNIAVPGHGDGVETCEDYVSGRSVQC
jgi:hypothetical protein